MTSTVVGFRPDSAWRQLSRVTGIAGISTLILLFVPIVAGSGRRVSRASGADEKALASAGV